MNFEHFYAPLSISNWAFISKIPITLYEAHSVQNWNISAFYLIGYVDDP